MRGYFLQLSDEQLCLNEWVRKTLDAQTGPMPGPGEDEAAFKDKSCVNIGRAD